jgi:hypothetical protein
MRHNELLVLTALAIASIPLSAGQIMYATGVDNNNNNLPGGSMDPHYIFSGPGYPFQHAILESASSHCTNAEGCFPAWVPGQWDSSNDSTINACCGVYDFTTTLDLTGRSPVSGTLVTFYYATDDTGEDILINGVYQAGSVAGYGHWNFLTPFTILGSNPALVYGAMNTITFQVDFTDSLTNGLTVQMSALTSTPEPTTFLLFGGALIGLGALGAVRKRQDKSVV